MPLLRLAFLSVICKRYYSTFPCFHPVFCSQTKKHAFIHTKSVAFELPWSSLAVVVKLLFKYFVNRFDQCHIIKLETTIN